MKLQLPTYHGPQEVGEGLVVGHHVLHDGAEAGPLPGLPRPGHRITHPLYLPSSAGMVPSLPSLSTLTASGHQPQLPSAGTRRLPLSTHNTHPGLAREAHTGLDTTTTRHNKHVIGHSVGLFSLGLGI